MNRSFKLLLIIGMVLIVLACYQIEIYAQADLLANKLQQVLDSEVENLDLPGIQASLRMGDYEWFSVSGSVDLEKEIPLTTQHIFRVGSVTKIFTAAVVMKLSENGEINLDDKVDKWFPDFPKSDIITVRQLLNHTSGIYNYTENFWFGLQSAIFTKKVWEAETVLASTVEKDFYFEPGDRHLYSNTNYLMLGLIIEKITAKPLEKVYQEYIFDPLVLDNTFFIPYQEIPDNLITGFDRDIIPLGTHDFKPTENSFATLGFSAGAIATTSKDLRQFIDSLFRGNFLSDNTLTEMMQYIEEEDPDVQNQIGYGLGLRVLEINGDRLYGHTGTIPGFGAAVFYCPEKDYSLAVVSNVSIFNQLSVVEKLINSINENNNL